MTGAMAKLLERGRFGMKPGLENIRRLCAKLGDPQKELGMVIHVAGTNGKGQVCALIDQALRNAGFRTGRYTSPHLVKVNERFFLDGRPADGEIMERAAEKVLAALGDDTDITYFEALTATAFVLYRDAKIDYTILETGLGGRLDATNICEPKLTIITKVGMDHCDWLGDTVAAIAKEKAGILKDGATSILGPNSDEVKAAIKTDYTVECEGDFTEQNKATARKALEILGVEANFEGTVWPGRAQKIGRFIVDGAHNPPGAEALVKWLKANEVGKKFSLVMGACGDKAVDEVIGILREVAEKGYAVKTKNPRSLEAEEIKEKMVKAGMDAEVWEMTRIREVPGDVLVCGSLFLAGEALEELGVYPWGEGQNDPWEKLK